MVQHFNFDDRTVKKIGESLKLEEVEKIDFDELQAVLQKISDLVRERETAISELLLLKTEYRDRIIGMLRANTACEKEDGDNELGTKLSDDPLKLSAAWLIKMYSKSAARFRSNFPASFKYIGPVQRGGIKNNWIDHKI